jgi:thioredoxin reductase
LVDVIIIGAGPYGLSIAAHLQSAGVSFRIFGKTMDSWKNSMPPGMLLKSHPWSSSLYDPGSTFTLRRFCSEQGVPYHDSQWFVPVETFVAYGEAFQKRLVPTVEPRMLVRLQRMADGFRAAFDDGTTVDARHVVIAVGIHPFKYVPEQLKDLPPRMCSHSGDHGSLDEFVGREVVVIGSGSSATDLAALLNERGASAKLLARARALPFSELPRSRRSLPRRLLQPLKPLIQPGSGIGAGWRLKIWADAPWVFHLLPAGTRLDIVRNTLGPLGHSSMKDRVVGKIPLYLSHTLRTAEVGEGKVALRCTTANGGEATITADHVIAATGYRIDLHKVGFFDPELLASIRCLDSSPVLSRNYESSVPGLYFVGAAAAASFGPVNRFVFGAIHPSRRLARHLAAALPHRAKAVPGTSRAGATEAIGSR